MTIGSENLSNGSSTAQDQFSGGVSAYRRTRREAALAAEQGGGEAIGHAEVPLPIRWTGCGPPPSMADHPLLRGLLLELPARGAIPAADWLDRWFEAARSILELLYVQEAKKK